MLEVGLKHSIKTNVMEKDTAKEIGSGGLNVFATPALIALMENAAFNCVETEMEEGYSTVGISVNMKHLKASAVGDEVECIATLTAIDDKKLTFEIIASTDDKLIGKCTHERFIINSERFMSKL